MPDANPPRDPSESRRPALSRWDNEGGAIAAILCNARGEIPAMNDTELVQLRIRVIALDNIVEISGSQCVAPSDFAAVNDVLDRALFAPASWDASHGSARSS